MKRATTRMGITDTEPTPWVGVVLAGGRSSRMGRDKAGLAWRDQTLLAHAYATLQAAGACKVVVSGDYPEHAGIPDALPSLGPLGGLVSVVDALPDGVLLLVPVDMPLLTPELLDQLARHRATPCVTYRDHVLPMRLVVDSHTRGVMTLLLAGTAARRSLRVLHATLGGQFIQARAGQLAQLVNCNTPEQWQAVAP